MARNSLLCADVPLRNYSLTHPSRHRPHLFHWTAFTDSELLNGFLFLFSFSINLLVRLVQ